MPELVPTPYHLPQHTVLGEDYTILSVLGQGGFGITYLAQDKTLNCEVVIKENLPTQFAGRDSTTLQVRPFLSNQANYEWAKKRFLDEARLLARLNHPHIVRVHRAFNAYNTAYYVMPWIGGKELGAALREQADGTTEAVLLPILRQLLNALSYLHSYNLLHRDIKPSNILLTADGSPVLIDFGATRAMVSERSQTLLESPGYTPFEQLQSHGRTGPWTDLYSLGATFYHLITGELPPRSSDRMGREDAYRPLAERPEMQARYSLDFLRGIDKALSLWPEDRWQTAEDWANSLSAAPTHKLPQPVSQHRTESEKTKQHRFSATRMAERLGLSGVILLLLGYIAYQHLPFAADSFGDDDSEEVVFPPTDDEEAEAQQMQGVAEQVQFIKHQDTVSALAFSADGKYIATGCADKTAFVTELATGKRCCTIKHNGGVRCLAFSGDGKYIATGGWGNRIQLTEIATGRPLHEVKIGLSAFALAFSPDSRTLAVGLQGKAVLFDVTSAEQLNEVMHHDFGFNQWVNDLVFSADGKDLVSGGHVIRISDTKTGDIKNEITFDGNVGDIILSPHGTYAAMTNGENNCILTRTKTGDTLRQIKHSQAVRAAAFSADDRYIATGGDDKTLRITRVASGKTEQEFNLPAPVEKVIFSPNGHFLAAACADKIVRLYDTDSGKKSGEIPGTDSVKNIVISPEGTHIAVARDDNSVRIYKLKL